MIHFPNLFPLQNINKQTVHNYVVNFFIQAKWAHNYSCHSFLVCICKVNAHSSEYRHPSQRLHRSSPIAPLPEHQKTQDTLRTDEPSPIAPLSPSTGKDSITKERLGLHSFKCQAPHPYNPVLSSPSWIKLAFD